ncbi:hypothetical protein [Brevibacterium sediminis]
MLALRRRATEGGSYRVEVSLAGAAVLLQRQGLITAFEDAPGVLSPEEFVRYAVLYEGTVYGDLKSLGPVISMSETLPVWERTTPYLGSHPPEWLPH